MITIYSKAQCPFCVQAKNLLESKGFRYNEVRIDLDEEAKRFVLSQGHRTVPQLYYNGKLFVEGGFEGLKKLSIEEIKNKLEESNVSEQVAV